MQAIVTPAEMGAIDAAAPEPVAVLVERAGWAVAREALRLLGGSYGRRVVVIAGKGNNGADGRSAARHLRRRGVRCVVLDATDASTGSGATLPPADLIIDAAYGTGFRGSYHHAQPDDSSTPILAVDIPSGIDGTTGEAHGEPWRATRTVTFAALKPGLLLADGPDHAGDVVVADIGLDTSTASAHRIGLDVVADLGGVSLTRPRDLHKWRHAVWVVAGSPGMTGAAHLASRAAQRAGASYVRLSTPGSATDPFAPPEVVTTVIPEKGWSETVSSDLDRFAALAVGPGLGRGQVSDVEVRRLLSTSSVPTVVDGDGLRALGSAAETRALLTDRPAGAGPVVLTPHDGEFESFTGAPPGADRFAAVRDLARAVGAVVLLKGPTTIVADPSGQAFAVTEGDHRLATAGTGDVLTGIITALLAQGLDGTPAAAVGAVLHGRSGALAFPRGLVAGDLVDHLPAVLSEAFRS